MRRFLLSILAAVCGVPLMAQVKPVWADEFDTDGLPDTSKSTYDTGGHGWGNRELHYYTANRAENATVKGGLLLITARKEEHEGKAYTSARMVSKAGWKYGYIKIRARLPKGRGTWPALWMLPVSRWEKGGQDGLFAAKSTSWSMPDTTRAWCTARYTPMPTIMS